MVEARVIAAVVEVKAMAVTEVWMFGLLVAFGCFAIIAILICAAMIGGFIRSANDGTEERKEERR